MYVRFDLGFPDGFKSAMAGFNGSNWEISTFFKILKEHIFSLYGSDIEYAWSNEQEKLFNCLILLRADDFIYPITELLSHLWSRILNVHDDSFNRTIERGTIMTPYGLATGEEFDYKFSLCLAWASYLSQIDDFDQYPNDYRRFGFSRIFEGES